MTAPIDRIAAEVAAQLSAWPWAETVTIKARGENETGKRTWTVEREDDGDDEAE